MCNITTSSNVVKGKTYTYFSVYANGKRRRFKTKAEAQAFAKSQEAIRKDLGKQVADVFCEHGAHIALAIELLKNANIPQEKIVDAVKEFVARNELKHGDATIQEAIETYIQDIDGAVSPKTKTVAAQAVTLFAEAVGKDTKVSAISQTQCVDALKSICINKAPATHNSILRRLKTFASWADANGYAMSKELFAKVKPMLIAAKEPRFISIKEMARVLLHIWRIPNRYEKQSAYQFVALSFFAGIRTSEILALDCRNDINAAMGRWVRVSRAKGASRGRRGRLVILEKSISDAILIKDISPFTSESLANGYSIVQKILKRCNIQDARNIARHSFITYHVALHNDEQQTVTICGTSKDMAAVHYKGLATQSDAELYFKLLGMHCAELKRAAGYKEETETTLLEDLEGLDLSEYLDESDLSSF